MGLVEDLVLPGAVHLSAIHGDVGVAQHLFRALVADLGMHYADAGGDEEPVVFVAERLQKGRLEPLDHLAGAFRVAVLQQDGELVTA